MTKAVTGTGCSPWFGWAPWVAFWVLLLFVTLGLQPLSGREAGLLEAATADSGSGLGSPFYSLLLRALVYLGPPGEVVLRALSIFCLAAGGVLAAKLCRFSGASPLTASLVAICSMAHGALLLATVRLGPAIPTWAAEAFLLFVAVRARNARRLESTPAVLLCGAAVLVVSLDPLAFLLLLVVGFWLGAERTMRQAALLLLLPAGAALLSLLFSYGPLLAAGFRLPDPFMLGGELLGLGASEGIRLPPHPLVVASGPTIALVLIGLAMTGWARARSEMRVMSLALFLPPVAALFWHRGVLWSGVQAALLLPPLLMLGAGRLQSVRASTDRTFWLLFLVGLSGLTGARTLTNYHHDETRRVAAMLSPDERTIVHDPGVEAAIEFYRPASPVSRFSPVRIWRPGDREPRLVAVHALGDRAGRLWLVRPGEPLFDAMDSLSDAVVSYRENENRFDCPWQPRRSRFFCGGPEYLAVSWSHAVFAGVGADAIYLHPLDDGVLEVRWEQVPLGRRLVGVAGLDDGSLDFSAASVSIEVRVGSLPPMVLARGSKRGLVPFELDTSGQSEHGSIVLRVTTSDDRGRHAFVDLLTVR